MKQIAIEADCSVMAVSCALRGKTGEVSSATRDRIVAVAERLGYRPNLLVRAMQTGRTRNLGVVVPPYGDFTRRIVNGIHDALATEDCLPMVHWSKLPPGSEAAADEAGELAVIHRLLDRRVDGVILYPSHDWVFDLHLREVHRRRVPLVTIDRVLSLCPTDFVGTDDTVGATLAARHLLALGHRQVAQLAGEGRYGTYAERRLIFAAVMNAGGGRCATSEIPNADHSCLREYAGRILDTRPRPTGVFLGSDAFAPAFIQAARERGLRIPRDLSLVGFADLTLAGRIDPPLTTVRQDPEGLGREAVRMVMDRCRGLVEAAPCRHLRLVPCLVERGSTAAPTVRKGRS